MDLDSVVLAYTHRRLSVVARYDAKAQAGMLGCLQTAATLAHEELGHDEGKHSLVQNGCPARHAS